MRTAPDGTELPRGVIYDPAKRRFRVRLYARQRPVWTSYHYDHGEALAALERAKAHRERVMAWDETIKATSLEQIRAMRDKQIHRRRP